VVMMLGGWAEAKFQRVFLFFQGIRNLSLVELLNDFYIFNWKKCFLIERSTLT
jgi:hypothetical protein